MSPACPYCGSEYLVAEDEDLVEYVRNEDGRRWFIVISDSWLAHRCEIATEDTNDVP